MLGDIAAGVCWISVARSEETAEIAGDADVTPQHELLLSSRLAVVNDLVAGVAAMRSTTLLTTILGYTHLLLRYPALPQTTRDDIGRRLWSKASG